MDGNKRKIKLVSIGIITCILLGITSFMLLTSKKEDVSTILNEGNTGFKVISKLPTTKTLDSNTVTIQQGNLYAYVDTDIGIDNSIASYRTYYGKDETVVVIAQFNQIIKSCTDSKLIIQFGTGDQRSIAGTVEGSTIVFRYNIDSGDNGELKVIGLSGTVVDMGNNSIQIGLPSGGLQYISGNSIYAYTDNYKISYSSDEHDSEDGKVHIHVSYQSKLYILDNKVIRELYKEELKEKIKVYCGEYEGRGTVEIQNLEEKSFEIVYTPVEGDNGIISFVEYDICDIAGNLKNKFKSKRELEEINIENTKTPFVKNFVLFTNTTEVEDIYYCNESKYIYVALTYNEKIYGKSKTELTTDNAGKIKLKIGDSIKEMSALAIADDCSIVYGYAIKSGDNGNITGIEVPEGIVYDYVGHPSQAKSIVMDENNKIDGKKIVVDTIKPVLSNSNIINMTECKVYKKDEDIGFYINFNEKVKGNIEIEFSDSEGLKRWAEEVTDDLPEWAEKRTFKYDVKNGDNGYLIVNIKYEDMAGNVNEGSYICKNIYADTTAPSLNIEEEKDEEYIIYNFELSDNSENWKNSNDEIIQKSGIKSNTFTLDDIILINGTIISSENDSNGNVSKIKVLENQEGKQKVIVSAGKISDGVGNLNNSEVIIEKTIDTKPPVITNIEKSISDWTNKNIMLTVLANDEVSGIKEYSYDGGKTWDSSNIHTIMSNGIIEIQVKDNNDNIANTQIIVTNIDKVVPTLEVTQTSNETTDSKITIQAKDSESGIESVEINGTKVTLTNNEYTFIAKENGTYTVTVIDKAGNSITKTIEVTNIKEEVFEDASIVYEKNGGTYTLNKDGKVTIEENVTVSNVAISKIEYAWTNDKNQPTEWINGGNSTTLNIKKECTKAGENYLFIKTTDTKGHTTISCSNVYIVEEMQIILNESLIIKNEDGIDYIIFSKETTMEEVLNNIKSNKYTIKIKNAELTQDVTKNVKTGDNVVIEELGNEILYTIVIKGDINSDGKIDISDMFKLNKYRLGKIQLNSAEWLAGDVTEDKTINISDMFKINKFRLGKIESL